MERLDNFSKILLATQTVNYLAASLHTVAAQTPHKDTVASITESFEQALIPLRAIMEDLGNVANGLDCVCPIDERITYPAFDIVIHGHDNVDE